MSVLIKGMRIPKDCRECKFQDYGFTTGDTWCGVNDAVLARNFEAIKFDGRPEWCPLVEVPEPHGRLIDADMLIKFVEDRYEITWESDCYEGGIKDACSDILEKIDTMPTVIEAEDGE
jgi:hypothetical protein